LNRPSVTEAPPKNPGQQTCLPSLSCDKKKRQNKKGRTGGHRRRRISRKVGGPVRSGKETCSERRTKKKRSDRRGISRRGYWIVEKNPKERTKERFRKNARVKKKAKGGSPHDGASKRTAKRKDSEKGKKRKLTPGE